MNIRIGLAPEELDDFECILAHLETFQAPEPAARIDGILAAVDLLKSSPLIGRPLADGKRELVIGTGAKGYVALYRYIPEIQTVLILVVRGQREAIGSA